MPCVVTDLKHTVNVNTLETQPAKSLALNEVGVANISLSHRVTFEPFADDGELGSFILSGKSRPVVIHELLGTEANPEAASRSGYLARFAEGLAAFRAGDRHSAESLFAALQAENNQDGVLRFFLARCRMQPPPDWDGIIRMDLK